MESKVIPATTHVDGNISTKTTEKYEPCSFCLVIIDHGSVKRVDIAIERSESCMKKLALHLQSATREDYQLEQSYRVFRGRSPKPRDQATHCWICCWLGWNETKDLNHCRYSVKFLLGLMTKVHSQGYLKRTSIKYTPVIAHNSSNYELPQLCTNVQEFG